MWLMWLTGVASVAVCTGGRSGRSAMSIAEDGVTSTAQSGCGWVMGPATGSEVE